MANDHVVHGFLQDCEAIHPSLLTPFILFCVSAIFHPPVIFNCVIFSVSHISFSILHYLHSPSHHSLTNNTPSISLVLAISSPPPPGKCSSPPCRGLGPSAQQLHAAVYGSGGLSQRSRAYYGIWRLLI